MSRWVVLIAVLPAFQEAEYRALQTCRGAIRDKREESVRRVREAHESLDQGEYEAAIEHHRRARALDAEVVALKKSEVDHVRRLVDQLVPRLNHDELEVRARAEQQILSVGPLALGSLERAKERAVADKLREVEGRLAEVIARLRVLEIDEEGRVRQWAATARASSEYTNTRWSAMQAAGKPDTPAGGDCETAWASLQQDAGEEWLELVYEHAVQPTHVRVRETFNPGAVIRVDALGPEGQWHELWKGKDTTAECPGWLTVVCAPIRFNTRTVRLTLDSAGVPGWNEIDAVELIGRP